MRTIITTLLALLTLTTSAMAEPPVLDNEDGWWDASLIIDNPNSEEELAIRFLLWIPANGVDHTAVIMNAGEYVGVEFEWVHESLELSFPYYDSEIEAQYNEGRFDGVYRKQRADGIAEMQFTAVPLDPSVILMDSVVFPFDMPVLHNSNGSEQLEQFAMEFEKSGPAKGQFTAVDLSSEADKQIQGAQMRAQSLRGTILTPTGDYRHLGGRRHTGGRNKGEFNITVFDGAHAFLFTADIDPTTGDLTNGHFYSGNHWHETFTARRLKDGEEYELPDPFSEVSLKPGVTRVGIPKLNEAPYAGKPTIVQIFGTWCPNCHDEAPVLVDLYERYHAEGLQILSLAYEYTPDIERSTKQINRFKERHGATWEFVAAGVNDKKKAATTLPALNAIKSYPTTIWINPDGTVRAIHSGFSGPATGDAHTKTLEEFEHLTKQIIESQ